MSFVCQCVSAPSAGCGTAAQWGVIAFEKQKVWLHNSLRLLNAKVVDSCVLSKGPTSRCVTYWGQSHSRATGSLCSQGRIKTFILVFFWSLLLEIVLFRYHIFCPSLCFMVLVLVLFLNNKLVSYCRCIYPLSPVWVFALKGLSGLSYWSGKFPIYISDHDPQPKVKLSALKRVISKLVLCYPIRSDCTILICSKLTSFCFLC